MKLNKLCSYLVLSVSILSSHMVLAQTSRLDSSTVDWIKNAAESENGKVVAWRQDIHRHPELGRFEIRTGKLVADHLRSLGISVETGVAKTGVIGVLKGGLPGPVVALRADMDALPVKEQTGLPFASQDKGIYFGEQVDVMHACGHDAHVAMLMGAAEILAKNKERIAGTVVFIFQPSEEGPADLDEFDSTEDYGAKQIVKEGILDKYNVESIFGIHVIPRFPTGQYVYREGAIMSSIDDFRITVTGKGTHGSAPWSGSDTIYSSAQIINGVQSLVSRRIDLTTGAGVVSFGTINGGLASNILPNEVKMVGTIRTASAANRNKLLKEFPPLVESIAKTYQTQAKVDIAEIYPVTMNHPQLTRYMMPILGQLNSANLNEIAAPFSASEDFSFYAEKVPGLFVNLGISNADKGRDISQDPNLHSSEMMLDEDALKYGVMAHVGFVMGYPNIAAKVKP